MGGVKKSRSHLWFHCKAKTVLTKQEQMALNDFKTNLSKIFGSQFKMALLYGSRAREEGDAESDLDVLVILSEKNRNLTKNIANLSNDLLLKYEILISPLVLSEKQYDSMKKRERLLSAEIQRDGIVL